MISWNWNKEKTVAILFIMIIYGIFAGLCLSVVMKMLGREKIVVEKPKLRIDYEVEYPFTEKAEVYTEEVVIECSTSAPGYDGTEGLAMPDRAIAFFDSGLDLIKRMEEKIKVYINMIDTYSYAHVPFRSEWINIYGILNKCKGSVIIDSEILIVKLKNGKLSYVYPSLNSNGQEEYLGIFAEKLEAQEIDFLYVNCPFKIDERDKELPWAVEDNTNEGVTVFLNKLREENIEVLDLRDTIYASELDYYDMFYTTDHHWTTESGFWAAGQIAEYMNNNWEYDFNMTYLQGDNYNRKVYSEWYAGSQGKKTGIGYVKADDFVLLTPRFDTDFEIEIRTRDYFGRGSFEETLYDYSQVQQKNFYLYNLYNGYLYDDNPLTQIHNLQIANGKRILILKDSFALTVVPFLAAAEGAEYVDVIDLRWFTGSLEAFMKENRPDSVVMIYNPGMLDYRDYRDNHNNPWNME